MPSAPGCCPLPSSRCGGGGQVSLTLPRPLALALAPKLCTYHLASYIGRCHRSCVRQGCHGCRRNGSYCTGNRGAPPTKRKCYTSGATKSGGGRCKGGAPSPLLQPQPPLYRPPLESRVWRGGGFNAPLPTSASPVPVLPATPAAGFCEGGRGLPSVTTSSAPPATWLRGTSRPLLNCHTPLLSFTSLSPQTPEAGREPPPPPCSAQRPSSVVLPAPGTPLPFHRDPRVLRWVRLGRWSLDAPLSCLPPPMARERS